MSIEIRVSESPYCAKYLLINSSIFEIVQSKNSLLLILDRDGVLIEDFGYVNHMDNVSFRKLLIERVVFLQELGWRVAIVTNQSGVSRNYFSEEECVNFNKELCRFLEDEFKLRVDILVYCPNHPSYTRSCVCRKPEPGLINQVLEILDLTPMEAIFVGDKHTDWFSAKNSGVAFMSHIDFEKGVKLPIPQVEPE